MRINDIILFGIFLGNYFMVFKMFVYGLITKK